MIQMAGRRGKIVWLPTFDAENQVRFAREDRPFVSVVRDGKPVPELDEIFKLIAQNGLVLATGHSSADESLAIIAAAREAGIKQILVTHVLAEAVHATPEHMRKMAALRALMECTWLTHFAGAAGAINVGKPVPIAELSRAIRDVGAEHFVISSDFGQQGNPTPPDGMRAFITALRAEGMSEREIDLLARRNPARLLGLEP
jgi:microsomal dipeptidase-like Zn-dependent dipeptidase